MTQWFAFGNAHVAYNRSFRYDSLLLFQQRQANQRWIRLVLCSVQ